MMFTRDATRRRQLLNFITRMSLNFITFQAGRHYYRNDDLKSIDLSPMSAYHLSPADAKLYIPLSKIPAPYLTPIYSSWGRPCTWIDRTMCPSSVPWHAAPGRAPAPRADRRTEGPARRGGGGGGGAHYLSTTLPRSTERVGSQRYCELPTVCL